MTLMATEVLLSMHAFAKERSINEIDGWEMRKEMR